MVPARPDVPDGRKVAEGTLDGGEGFQVHQNHRPQQRRSVVPSVAVNDLGRVQGSLGLGFFLYGLKLGRLKAASSLRLKA